MLALQVIHTQDDLQDDAVQGERGVPKSPSSPFLIIQGWSKRQD